MKHFKAIAAMSLNRVIVASRAKFDLRSLFPRRIVLLL